MARAPLMAEPVFDRQDLVSPIWIRLREHLKEQLAERREYNDGLTLNDVETAVVRGEIKEIKRILRLGDPDAKRKAPG